MLRSSVPIHFRALLHGSGWAELRSRIFNCIAARILLYRTRYSRLIGRNTSQSDSDHGEADAGSLRTVPSRRVEGRTRRGHQQEALARDHQGPQSSLFDHQRCIHA